MKIFKYIVAFAESALVGLIGFIVLVVICSVYADSLKSSGGTVLASELISLRYAPYFIGVLVGGFYFKIKCDDI